MFFKKLFKPKTRQLVTSCTITVYSDLNDGDEIIPGRVKDAIKTVALSKGFSIISMDVDSIGLISKNPVTGEKIRVHGKYAKISTVKHTFELLKTQDVPVKKIKELKDNLFLDEINEIEFIRKEIVNEFDQDKNRALFEVTASAIRSFLNK